MKTLDVIRTIVALISVTVIIAPTSCRAGSAGSFSPGEKLTFQLKWGPIPAGEAMLELLPIEVLDDQPVYHFVMTVRTNAFLDLFYAYRSRIDAYADTGMTHSLRYREQTRIRHKRKDVSVDFDWKKKQARFKRIDTAIGSTSEKRITERATPLLDGAFDPLSVYYYTRLLELKVGDRIQRPISDGLTCAVADAEVVKREEVAANGTMYDTYLVQPDFKGITPVFEKLAGAAILFWVSTDARRLPIKLASRIALGQITGELTSVESY